MSLAFQNPAVLCIGSALKDVFFPFDGGVVLETPDDVLAQRKLALELGAKYAVTGRTESPGGCALNVATGLVVSGVAAAPCAAIGDDATGQWIREECGRVGVRTDFLLTQTGHVTDLSFILVHASTGERIIVTHHDAAATLTAALLPVERMTVPWIVVSALHGDWTGVCRAVCDHSEKTNAKIVFNPGQKMIAEGITDILHMIAHAAVLYVNKDEATEIVLKSGGDRAHINEETYLVECLHSAGAQIVFLTDGARGAWGGIRGGEIEHRAVVKVEARDLTGAGDAFTAASLAALIHGESIGAALEKGVMQSARVVQYYGATRGLRE